MKILLLGKNGQIGWELQRSLAALGTVVALDRQGDNGLCGDLTNPHGLARMVQDVQPDVIVNAAAHTAVDKAEAEPELAYALNTHAPGVLAQQAYALNALLVHYSTDYVFDGRGVVAHTEMDAPAPLSVYGHTKLEGERRIVASGCRHLIFRTSWVYAARGNNFAKTMLRLAQERQSLTIINDQWGAPTGADLVADVTAHAIRHVCRHQQTQGLYHLVAAGQTNWHAYAQYVLEQAQQIQPSIVIKATDIAAVPTSAFPTAAQRPHNSRLDSSKLQSTFALQMPDWQQGVVRMLREIL